MRPNIQEARDFLVANQDLLDEMMIYDKKRNMPVAEEGDADEKLLNEYHRLKTFILEKKMGLLDRNS